MYEIPPSVDKYLRISKKSRIHYPVVSEERSLGLTDTIDVIPNDYPTFVESSSFFELNAGVYIDDTRRRKRSFEEYMDQQENELQSEKLLKVNRSEVSEEISSWPTDYHKHIDNDNAVRDLQHQADYHTSYTLFNRHARQSKQLVHNNLLPDLKPKQAINSKPPAAQTIAIESNGKGPSRKNPWGPQSYSELISAAIRASTTHQASLQQIYDWIVHNIPWFSDKGDYPSTKGWKVGLTH